MSPTCSIVVSIYNQSRFLDATVASALGQTYQPTEVIVVDDGSTDGSLDRLRAYGDRIRLITKANGGQASAMNRGFSASTGEIVFFLDGDDLLLPDTAARVAAAWTPKLAKIHFRLNVVDADGRRIGDEMLPPYRTLPAGDLRPTLARFGFYPAPPSSGNAYSRFCLQQIMPAPEEVFRYATDTWTVGTAALFGDIGVLDGFGGSYRQHAGNVSVMGLEKLAAEVRRDMEYVRLVRERWGGRLSRRFEARWPLHLKRRVILARFSAFEDVEQRPMWSLVRDYVHTVVLWPEYGFVLRLKFVAWAMALLLLPARVLAGVPGIVGGKTKLR